MNFGMPYTVNCCFDPTGDERITSAWQTIASPLPANGSRPHISIAVFDEVDAEVLNETVQYFFSYIAPFQVYCNSYGTFPGKEEVLFLAPVVTDALLELHAHFHSALKMAGLESHPLYRPGAWVPHCTLATDLSPTQTLESLEKLNDIELRGSYTIDTVNCCYFRPVQELARFSLRT